jgi:arginine repressor
MAEEVNRSQAIRDHFKLNPKATTQEVVDALASHGIVVSATLVRTVKAKHNQRRAAKKVAKTAAASEAKTNGVNKTQAVRDYLTAHKTAKNAEVVAALAQQGIAVSPTYVSKIKAKRKTRRRAVKQVVAEGVVSIPEIKAAFAFLKAAGSVAVAKQALAAALEIKKVV